MQPTPDLSALRDGYLSALADADAPAARALVEDAVRSGTPAEDVLLLVLEPVMYEVGRRWAQGRLSAAHEHYASVITEQLVSSLAAGLRQPPVSGRLAVVGCTEGEQHAIGPQIVTALLEHDGWEVLPLGASVPGEDLVSLVEAEQPDVVALSTTMPDRLPAARRTAERLSAAEPRPFIAIGGQAWIDVPPDRLPAVDVVVSDARALLSALHEAFGEGAP